jgi:gliding motility-associated lipoprotein GldH
MKRIVLLLLVSAFLVSCGSKMISDQQKSFKDRKWQRSQVLTYAFNIADTASRYDISATVKYFDNFPFDKVQLTFSLDDPSGEKRTSEHDLVIRNKDGRFLGKKTGDTLVMNFAIRNHYRFKASGLVKVTLINQLPYPETEGIGGICIVVKKK